MQQLRFLLAMALLYFTCKKHDAEQQDRDYLQLHNNRTTYYWQI